MLTAQHTEVVVLATGCLPVQLYTALLLGGSELGDAVAILETVVRQVTLVRLLQGNHERVPLSA